MRSWRDGERVGSGIYEQGGGRVCGFTSLLVDKSCRPLRTRRLA